MEHMCVGAYCGMAQLVLWYVPSPLLQQSVSSPDYRLLLHRHEVHSRSLEEIQSYLA